MTLGATALSTMFSTPTTLGAVVASTTFSKMFEEVLLPLVLDIGTVLFQVGCIGGIYLIMRADAKGGTTKIKWAMVGYAMLKLLTVFTTMIDRIIANIHIPM